MTTDDMEAALAVRAPAFDGLPDDPPAPPPEARPRAADWWQTRTRHLIETGEGACVVAEDDGGDDGGAGGVIGFATSLRRDDLWCLATFAVLPDRHGAGIGRALLDAVDPGGRAMLSSSVHPGAMRTYHRRGFRLTPMMRLEGTLDRRGLPAVTGVREGGPADLDLLDAVDRRVRGAARRIDHRLMLDAGHRLLVVDSGTRAGYASIDGDALEVLAATDEDTAADLLRTVLAEGPGSAWVPHVSGTNSWAVAVGLDAGLLPRTTGYLATRGMAPPVPYVHHGSLL